MSQQLTAEERLCQQEEAFVQSVKIEHVKRHEELTKYRAALQVLCETDADTRAAELKLCKEDFFHWVRYYVWTHDPREEPQVMPFDFYEYQIEDAQWVLDNIKATIGTIEKRDLLVEKSRGIGWSWLIITVAVWFWLFHNKSSLFGSRKLEEADTLNDMGSLLEKARFIIRRLPDWMLPKGFDSNKHLGWKKLQNPLGGEITGEASCADFGRGDRKLFIVLDEFATWPHDLSSAQACTGSTNCRIFISTPKGPFNLFAMMARSDEHPGIPKPIVRRRHWSEHPVYGAALRTDHNNKLTSPWYRRECQRLTSDGVAAELDINYVASTQGLVFSEYTPEIHRAKCQADPMRPIIRVWDPGNDFYVLWMQVDRWGRVLCLDEMHVESATIHDVASAVLLRSQENYPDCFFEDYGDPAGTYKGGSAVVRPEFEILQEDFDIWVDVSGMGNLPTKDRVKTRILAIHNQLKKFCAQTRTQALLIDHEKCRILDRALLEGYRYKVDKHFQRVIDGVVDEQHPYEDAVDCLGMGVVSKLGLALNRERPRYVKVAKNVIRWGKRKGFLK